MEWWNIGPPMRFSKVDIHFWFYRQHKFLHQSNIDMAAKRHKKRKNKVSGLLVSRGYNE